MQAFHRLRRIEQVFVELYVKHRANGSAAMRELRPRTKRPRELAWRIRQRPGVKEAIEELTEILRQEAIAALGLDEEWVIRRVMRIADFDHRKLYDAQGAPLPIHQLPEEIATALAGHETEEVFEGQGRARRHTGRIHKYKQPNQVEAQKVLLNYLKPPVQRLEHTGKNGERLPAPAGPVYVIQKEEAKQIEQDLDEKV